MTDLWLSSYLVLWGLVVVEYLVLVGILRQTGLLQARLRSRPAAQSEIPEVIVMKEDVLPALEDDGPVIGARLPDLTVDSVNGFGSVKLSSMQDAGGTLLVFMSPMCDSCQHTVGPLNTLVQDNVSGIRPVAIMLSDEHAGRSFLSVFPLHMPLVCDSQRKLTYEVFDVHRNPFGLLYDEHGMLIRKGIVSSLEELLALLGDTSMPEAAQAVLFPELA